MPNYYAHLQFGAQVLEALPEPVRALVERERDAYTLGQYGPDPLFFCRLLKGGRVRTAGREMHRRPVRPVMERLRLAVEEERPFAAGYAAGFLCHFALDSRCHAYIKRWERQGGITHARLETELDRFLMTRDGVDLLHETPLPTPQMPDAFDRLLEEYVYLGITGREYRNGLDFYRKVSSWHTRTAGSRPAGRCFDLAARASSRGAAFRDMVLKREAGPVYVSCREKLTELLYQQVPETAGKLAAFFQGGELDAWFDRDFNGELRQ